MELPGQDESQTRMDAYIIINCSIIVVQLEKYQYFITFPPPSLSSSPSTKIEGVLGLLSFEYLFGESAIETEMDILLQLLFSQRDSQTDRQSNREQQSSSTCRLVSQL